MVSKAPVAPASSAVASTGAPVDDLLELLLRYDRPVPRYTSYPTAAAFAPGVRPADLEAELGRSQAEPLSLYVHVPFCRHACWYCGCNRVTTWAGSRVVAPFLHSLARELELLEQAAGGRRQLAQLHWGGGTPNYLTSAEQGRLWGLIERHFSLCGDLEASIEVNPEFLSRDEVFGLRRLGFNRVSFGIQDTDPEVQKAVNRVVPIEQLRRVMGWLRDADFESVNVDLICGLPLQTPERFAATLELVRQLRPDRISLFSFAYLPGQLPLQRRIAADDLPGARARLSMLEAAGRLLAGAGYDAIGMDHYALAGDSLAVAARAGRLHRNFQGYTTGGDLDLLGVGPSAISQFPTLFTQNRRDLKAWAADLEQGRLPLERGLLVRNGEVLERRALIQSVMCRFQVAFERRRFAREWEEFAAMEADGLVSRSLRGEEGVVEVTATGRWLIRTIAAVFDPAQRRQASGSQLI